MQLVAACSPFPSNGVLCSTSHLLNFSIAQHLICSTSSQLKFLLALLPPCLTRRCILGLMCLVHLIQFNSWIVVSQMENLHVWANSVQNIKIPEKEKIIQKCRRGLFKFGPKVSKVLIFLRKKQIIKNVEEGSLSSRPKCPKYTNTQIKKCPIKLFLMFCE